MNYKTTAIALSVAALTSACTSPQLNQKIENVNANIPTQAYTQALPNSAAMYGAPDQVAQQADNLRRPNLVRTSNRPWVGGIRTVARTEDKLPAIFNENFKFDFAERSSLNVVAARLGAMTGVPVRMRDDVFNTSRSGPPAAEETPAFPLPIAGSPLPKPITPKSVSNDEPRPLTQATSNSVRSISMVYSGRLRDFLEHLTSTLSLSWEYQNGAVILMRQVTTAYDMSAFPGLQSFQASSSGRSSASSSEEGSSLASQSNLTVTMQGKVNVQESILKTIQDILADEPNARATWADGSGRVVVTASRDGQAKVRKFIEQENKAIRRMVNVTFDLYSVRESDNDQKGVDWTSIFQAMTNKYGVSFKTPSSLVDATAGQLAFNMTSNNNTTTTNALLSLMSQYGESTQHRPISITTVNGQWDTKSRLSTDGYLKETTPGNGGTTGVTGAPGLKTDTVTTGDQFAVLPYVQDDNSVLVKYSISLSDLLGLFEVSTGQGDTFQKVQTPRIDAINASSTVILRAGETAVITGLTRNIATRDENRLSREIPIAAGGSLKASVSKEHFLVLMRATPL